MSVLDEVLAALSRICGAAEGEIHGDMELFEEGLLDSFGVVQLLLELEERLGISLELGELSREELSTPRKIAALVEERLE